MQANNPLRTKTITWLNSFLDKINEFTRFQIAVILTLIALLILGGAISLVRSRPRAIELKHVQGSQVQEQKKTLSVHVAGAVLKPGLYRLDEGSRVSDALQMAGGITPDGVSDDINLASRLNDGEKVLVPRSDQQTESTSSTDTNGANTLLNVNTADVDELDKLPGVGPSLAQRIIEYRKQNGPFSSIEELDNVSGIGQKKLESLKDLVTI